MRPGHLSLLSSGVTVRLASLGAFVITGAQLTFAPLVAKNLLERFQAYGSLLCFLACDDYLYYARGVTAGSAGR
jgi:hypothetical protein